MSAFAHRIARPWLPGGSVSPSPSSAAVSSGRRRVWVASNKNGLQSCCPSNDFCVFGITSFTRPSGWIAKVTSSVGIQS